MLCLVVVDGWGSTARGWRRQGSGGGEEEEREETRAQQWLQARNSCRSFLIRNCHWSLFLLLAMRRIWIRLSVRIWIRLSLRIWIRNRVSDPYSLNPDPACCWIRYRTDPMRIRKQTKIYYYKYCNKFNLGIWSKTVKNFFLNFLERTFRHEFFFFFFCEQNFACLDPDHGFGITLTVQNSFFFKFARQEETLRLSWIWIKS